MTERLLKAYFVEGRHVGRDGGSRRPRAGGRARPRGRRSRSLESNTYLDAVHADIEQARAYGINGVPFYVVDGRYGVSGAQDAETFTQVLDKVAAEKQVAA